MSELFNSIGQKVEQLAPKPTTNGTNGVAPQEQDDERIVEEIESLCMNCHKNVRLTHSPPLHTLTRH
jgi:zinc finger protein